MANCGADHTPCEVLWPRHLGRRVCAKLVYSCSCPDGRCLTSKVRHLRYHPIQFEMLNHRRLHQQSEGLLVFGTECVLVLRFRPRYLLNEGVTTPWVSNVCGQDSQSVMLHHLHNTLSSSQVEPHQASFICSNLVRTGLSAGTAFPHSNGTSCT